MSEINHSAGYTADSIKLPLIFNASRMKAEIEALNLRDFIYYDVLALRSPAHLVDPSLPNPALAEDYADGSWTEWLDTKMLIDSPYLTSVVDSFRCNTQVTLVRLLRLEAGAIVKEHSDPTLGLQVENSLIRLTIPIQSGKAVTFYLNNNAVPMKPGECWFLRLSDPHKIVNAGTVERINLTIDMVPNEWFRSLLVDAG